MRKENANGCIVYALHVREAGEKLHCTEVSSNERPGMSPSCHDKKEGLGCWLCCRAVFIPRDFNLKALQSGRFIISPVFPAVSPSLHGQKWPPNSRDQAAS